VWEDTALAIEENTMSRPQLTNNQGGPGPSASLSSHGPNFRDTAVHAPGTGRLGLTPTTPTISERGISATIWSSGRTDNRKRRIDEDYDSDNDEVLKRIRASAATRVRSTFSRPPSTPIAPPSYTPIAPSPYTPSRPRVPRNTLLISRDAPERRQESSPQFSTPERRQEPSQQPPTPVQEQARPIPATVPAATRTQDALPSRGNEDHVFTVTVLSLVESQPIAPAIRQQLWGTVDRFALSMEASITDLTSTVQKKDKEIKQLQARIVDLENHVQANQAGDSIQVRGETQDEANCQDDENQNVLQDQSPTKKGRKLSKTFGVKKNMSTAYQYISDDQGELEDEAPDDDDDSEYEEPDDENDDDYVDD